MSLRDLALTPRAVAVLVALRRGPLTVRAIADSIADPTVAETSDLLRLMADGIDGDRRAYRLVQTFAARRYRLTHDGLGWLQSQGLDASRAVKAALYPTATAHTERQAIPVIATPTGGAS